MRALSLATVSFGVGTSTWPESMMSGWRLLLCAICSSSYAAQTTRLAIPLTVNVGLLGFSADGAWQLQLDAAELYALLSRLLPERQPACGPDGRPAEAVYQISYNVVQLRTGLQSLHKVLSSAMRPVPSSAAGGPPRYEVRVSDVEDHFARTYESYFAAEPTATASVAAATSAYAVLIINPNRADMAKMRTSPAGTPPPADLSYHYVQGDAGGTPTQMWLSSGRYMVLDLSAAPCARGMTHAAEGAVSSLSVPPVGKEHWGGEEAKKWRENDPTMAAAYAAAHTTLLARLASLVVSAIRHVIAPDLRSCGPPPLGLQAGLQAGRKVGGHAAGGKLVIPVVVLTNHRAFDPLTPGHAHSLDIGALDAQVRRLLPPGATVLLLPSTHHIHDHPQISVALSRAARADTAHAHAQPYIDASALAHALRHSVDWLAAGLIHRSETPPAVEHLHNEWASNRTHATRGAADGPAVGGAAERSATRVLPLFLFSLLGYHPSLLLDSSSLVHLSDEAHSILVLQTNTSHLPVPFYSHTGAPLTLSTAQPTPHALAGLASALGDLLAPFESFSVADDLEGGGATPTRDFHWAVGAHPFGPYSSATSLPDVMVDAARRHALIARVGAAADTLRDAIDALEALAARYVHPAGSDAPSRREALGRMHEAGLAGGLGNGGYVEALRHLEADAALRAGGGVGGGGMRVRAVESGQLMSRLASGSLSLSSALAQEETLRLHAAITSHTPELVRIGEMIAAGELSEAHEAADVLLAATYAVAATTADEVRGLANTLSCCAVQTSRPRSYHLASIGALALGAVFVWLVVLRLTAPAAGRGPSVRVRPGAAAHAWLGWAAKRHAMGSKQY